jgi:hypothetical protein
MATNTRGSARRAQGERGETESRDRTEGADSRSHVASEAAASRGDRDESLPAPRPHARRAELNEDEDVASDADFVAEEDEEKEETVKEARRHLFIVGGEMEHCKSAHEVAKTSCKELSRLL